MFGQIVGALSTASSAAQVAQGLTASLAVLGTATEILQTQHAQDALEEYADKKRAIKLEENKRQQREMMRQKRIQQARIENRASQTGVADSSGVRGAISSIGTQSMSNLSFLRHTENLANEASGYVRSARKHQSMTSTAGAIANIGMQWGDFAALDRLAGK